MKTIAVLTLCLVGAAIAGPNSAVAQCSTGSYNQLFSSEMMVGDIPGGTQITVGQQFVVDCTAQLTTVSFQLRLDSSMNLGGQTCLASGDQVACVLMDLDHNELARVEQALTFSNGTQEVTFDFSDQHYGLNPGSYIVTWEDVTKSYLFFSTYGDVKPGWLHVNNNGTWTEQWSTDAYFAVHWDSAGVPNDQLAWGALKADYR